MSRFARVNLFIAFAFTVMADPVSSVAYSIEAALSGLDGDLTSLVPTMALVVGTIAAVAATYQQLIRRFPGGGGGPRGVAAAFGEGVAFIPLGALLVDFTLTVAISCAASASALIAYAPGLAGARVPLALSLAVVVALAISLGHRGRVVLATATLLFLLASLIVIGAGAQDALGGPSQPGSQPLLAGAALGPVLLAMPLGMALATGVESPSDAIAQLGQLSDRGRLAFGQLTIWLMVAIVGCLTLALAALAADLGVGLPPEDSTLLAEIGRATVGDGLGFGFFQGASALLLLAAAGSAYLAGSGVLRALAVAGAREGAGLLPARFAVRNRYFAPVWGIALVLAMTAVLIVLAGGEDQELVHFYAVSVFASFAAAIAGCARLSWRDGRYGELAVNALGLLLVAFVLALNLTRLDGVIALAASLGVALCLWSVWVRRGRPAAIAPGGHAGPARDRADRE
jgi:hypothetical protein